MGQRGKSIISQSSIGFIYALCSIGIAAAIGERSTEGGRKQCTFPWPCFLEQEGELDLRREAVPLGVEPPEDSQYWREKEIGISGLEA